MSVHDLIDRGLTMAMPSRARSTLHVGGPIADGLGALAFGSAFVGLCAGAGYLVWRSQQSDQSEPMEAWR